MTSLSLYEYLPNELWDHIFSYIPRYRPDVITWIQTAYNLIKVCPELRGCWIFNQLYLGYLLDKIFICRIQHFYTKAYLHVRNVHEYEFTSNRAGDELRRKSWSPQFRKIPTRSTQCALCKKSVLNPSLTSVMKHPEGVRGYFTVFEITCGLCKNKPCPGLQNLPDRYLLGSMLTGLQLEHPQLIAGTQTCPNKEKIKHVHNVLISMSLESQSQNDLEKNNQYLIK